VSRLILIVAVAWLLAVVVVASIYAQDVYRPHNDDERVDLPVPKPTRPLNRDEQSPTEEEKRNSNEDDESEEPPIEFFDEEVDADSVVFVLDKTGSMGWSVGHAITDENGRVIQNPSKWQQLVAEFKKSVMGLSENAKFSAVVYSCSITNLRYASPPRVGVMADAVMSIHTLWEDVKNATSRNRAQAISWIDNFHPYGGTPIHDAVKTALKVKGVETIILHTDGVNTSLYGKWWEEVDGNLVWEVPQAGKEIIKSCEAVGVTVYTFGHCLATSSHYSNKVWNLGKQMLKDVAQATGGTFTEVR